MNESKTIKLDTYEKWFKFYQENLPDCYKLLNIREPFGAWTLKYYNKYYGINNPQQLNLFNQDNIPTKVGRQATPLWSESAHGRARTSTHGGRTTNSPPPKIQQGGILE